MYAIGNASAVMFLNSILKPERALSRRAGPPPSSAPGVPVAPRVLGWFRTTRSFTFEGAGGFSPPGGSLIPVSSRFSGAGNGPPGSAGPHLELATDASTDVPASTATPLQPANGRVHAPNLLKSSFRRSAIFAACSSSCLACSLSRRLRSFIGKGTTHLLYRTNSPSQEATQPTDSLYFSRLDRVLSKAGSVPGHPREPGCPLRRRGIRCTACLPRPPTFVSCQTPREKMWDARCPQDQSGCGDTLIVNTTLPIEKSPQGLWCVKCLLIYIG